MHYYKFNIGDYASHTQHLDITEDMAYRRMLDWLYLHESPLPDNVDQIARLIRMRSHTDCIAVVLHEFFELGDYGWFQSKAMKEIDQYKAKSNKAKESAAVRWNKRDANALQTECDSNANHKPLTTNHKPLTNIKDLSPSAQVGQEVFDHWKAVMNKNNSAKLNAKRLKAIKARIKEGYSVDDMKLAINGCANTPHNMGQNDRGELFNDLELICRDGANLERFMGNVNRIQVSTNQGPGLLDFTPPQAPDNFINHAPQGLIENVTK